MSNNSKNLQNLESTDNVKTMYSQVNNELGDRYQPFLNYGYLYKDNFKPIEYLDPADAQFEISAQLYHYVTSSTIITNKDVLEVGSGRGGGSYYMKKYMGAKTVLGLEYLKQSVEISQKTFNITGLNFIEGDAECIPLEDQSIDVVVNIESSHCYPNIDNFFSEAQRVLRVGGHFCYADLTTPDQRNEIDKKLSRLSMNIISKEDITPNIIESLRQDNARKVTLISDMSLSKLREDWWLNEWACVGTKLWNQLNQGSLVYTYWSLKKN